MKLVILSIFSTTLIGAFGQVHAATVSQEILFTEIASHTNTSGQQVTSSELTSYNVGEWYYTFGTSFQTSNFSLVDEGKALSMSAGPNTNGNYAAATFSLGSSPFTNISVNFSLDPTSIGWGADPQTTLSFSLYYWDGTTYQIGSSITEAVTGNTITGGEGARSLSLSSEQVSRMEDGKIALIFNVNNTTLAGGNGVYVKDLSVQMESIPEPSTASLGLFALSCLLMKRRRS